MRDGHTQASSSLQECASKGMAASSTQLQAYPSHAESAILV